MTNTEALIPLGHFVRGTSCIAGTIISGACNKTKSHPCKLGSIPGTFLGNAVMCQFHWRVLCTQFELVPTGFLDFIAIILPSNMMCWLGLKPERGVLYILIGTRQRECATESDKRNAILQ